MTEIEKKVLVRLCAKIMEYVDLDVDKEAEMLIQWVITQNSIKKNNNQIRGLIQEYKGMEDGRRASIRETLEKGKEICRKRNDLYEQQQELKHQLGKIEREIIR